MVVADPAEPLRVQDLDIPPSLVLDIAVRRILREGQTTTMRLAERLHMSPVLADQVIEKLRHDRMIEIQGAEGRSYLLQLSEQGRTFASERMEASKYTGAMPVSLAEYTSMVEQQYQRPTNTRENIRRSFEDLVISEDLLAQLGPAIHTPGAIFLYGPPGTGKTSIAERMINTEHDTVLVPHAVEVDSQIITVYDPMVHVAVDPQPERLDGRWVRCARPSVIAGGELQAHQLELNYQSEAGVYLAPLQMIANNGVLTIDDFGRQSLTPEQLLNRWIVPLDRDVDFLSLEYGAKFQVPFLTKIVFATNLDPSKLADEAFYRRIGSKILVPPIEDDAFDEVLRRVAADRRITVQPEAPAILRKGSRELGDGDLRPYLPGAIATLITSIADYEQRPPVMDRTSLERSLEMFFSTEHDMRGDGEVGVTGPLHASPESGAPSDAESAAPTMSDVEMLDATEAVLASLQDLLWIESPEQARSVSAGLLNRLGLAPAAETAESVIDVDLSFGHGPRLVAERPRNDELAQMMRMQLDRYATAARRMLELAAQRDLLVNELGIDPATGLVNRDEITRLVGRLGPDDVVVVMEPDGGAGSSLGESWLTEFGTLLRQEVRARDHRGYLGDGRFGIVILGGGDQEPKAVLDRLASAWDDFRPDGAPDFAAGFARAGEQPTMALVAAGHALLRALEEGGGAWVEAGDADFA